MEYATLKERLKILSLHTISARFEEEAQKAAKLKLSYSDFLAKIVEEEFLARADRSISARIAKAKFPFYRTLEQFEFSFQPTLSPQQIKELAHLNFIDKAENIIFLGPPGTGKTHLSVAIGIKACIARKRVVFFTLECLLEILVAAKVDGTLPRRLAELSRIDLIIIDELGFNVINREIVHLFFQMIAKRYERGSIILTSNKNFDEWGDVFSGDNIAATGLLDRLLHHSHIIVINGPSYRTKDKLSKIIAESKNKKTVSQIE